MTNEDRQQLATLIETWRVRARECRKWDDDFEPDDSAFADGLETCVNELEALLLALLLAEAPPGKVCMHGHKTLTIGCVSCALLHTMVLAAPAPVTPTQEQARLDADFASHSDRAVDEMTAPQAWRAIESAPKDWTCLTCGHAHYFESDEAGFDSDEDIPWGTCKTCDCKAPNYNPAAPLARAPQEET